MSTHPQHDHSAADWDGQLEAAVGTYDHRTFNVRLTRDEVIRLAGSTRMEAEYLEEQGGHGAEAKRMHDRAAELFIIVDQLRRRGEREAQAS